MPLKHVILDHDGGHDDLVALSLLLASSDKVKLIGTIVTDADCLIEDAFSATGKIICLMHNYEGTEISPIGKSSLKAVNPFPLEWRVAAKNMDDFPCLNLPENIALWEREKKKHEVKTGEQLLADLVINSSEKVTICVTGPLSNVAWCIEHYGERFWRNVESCVIMGGAINVKGNVFMPNDGTDGTAEWNIYWDPLSAQTVFSCPHIKKVLFSLDSTNDVPVCSSQVQRYGEFSRYLLSQFVGYAWSSCTHMEVIRPEDGYYAWDVLTAAYIIDEKLVEKSITGKVTTIVEKNKSEGRTVRSKTEEDPSMEVILKVNASLFYDLVLKTTQKCLIKI